MITFLEISAAVNMQQGDPRRAVLATYSLHFSLYKGVVEHMEVLTLNPIDHKSATTIL